MVRLVYLCSSLCGVIGGSLLLILLLPLFSVTSVFALAPIIDRDPAPGRSPGPPERASLDHGINNQHTHAHNSVLSWSMDDDDDDKHFGSRRFSLTPTTSSTPPTATASPYDDTPIGDEQRNYLSTGHNNLPRSRRRRNHYDGNGDSKNVGSVGGGQQQHHAEAMRKLRINKLVAPDGTDNGAFEMNRSHENGTKNETETISFVSGAFSGGEEVAPTRTRRYAKNQRVARHSSKFHYATNNQRIDKDHDEEEDDDWQFMDLYCANTVQERESLRASFLNGLSDVIVTLSPQDNRILIDLDAVPELFTQPQQKATTGRSEGEAKGQRKSQPQRLTTAKRGTGGSREKNSPSVLTHRFQRVVEESKKGKEATDQQQLMSLLWVRGRRPQSSLTSLHAGNEDKDDGQTKNNKSPFQFDVTHGVFEANDGLVADVDYTGEL